MAVLTITETMDIVARALILRREYTNERLPRIADVAAVTKLCTDAFMDEQEIKDLCEQIKEVTR
jgi:hypothetical protein